MKAVRNVEGPIQKVLAGVDASKQKEIDERLGQLYGIAPETLMPWHYHDPFFQESPNVFGANLDAVFAKFEKEEIARLCEIFYAAIRLPVDDVLNPTLYVVCAPAAVDGDDTAMVTADTLLAAVIV